MALNILPIVKFISRSSSVASTVGSLINQYKKLKDTPAKEDIYKIQSEINEKLQVELESLQKTIQALQKSLKSLTIIIFITLGLTIVSIILWLIK